ncbi:MAG: ornithine--oxo-acid transaminase [Planctomycetota bacterium]|jgi:ornithine--oxo-acid transaminase
MRSSKELIALESRYGAHNYHPLPIVIARGRGAWVWDPEGKMYLDCLASYSALNQGYGHPRILDAVRAQLETGVTLTSRAFFNTRLGEFLEKVVGLCGMEKALPMNTGAEAVETAIKMARKHGYQRRSIPDGEAEIIAFTGNFHGRTTTVVGFSTEEQYKEGFGPFTPGFRVVPYGDIDAFKAVLSDRTAGVLIEPIQGEGGIILPPEGYFPEMEALCRENGALLMLDEIQTGLGRTGKMFAYEHEGIRPDVLMLAKAISGGMLPVSVVVSVFRPGDHGSTYGGSPLGAAAACAAIDVLVEEDLPGRARELGEYLMDGLRATDSPHVKEVRGRGLLVGLEVKEESGNARPFCEKLMERGVLVKETHEQVIRFAPPLVVQKEDLDFLLAQVRMVLGEGSTREEDD